MPTLILSAQDIRDLLPIDACMRVMHQTLVSLAEGEAVQPLRSILRSPANNGALGVMPGWLPGLGMMGLKDVSVFSGNRAVGLESHIGVVLLHETTHGRLVAIADASEITAIRTAAVSGVATQALARDDAGDLAILGSGTQAETHLAAMRVARPLRRVRVWSRSADNARTFAARMTARHSLTVEVMPSVRTCVDGADLICTTTAAKEPILDGIWIAPGAHINAVGSSVAFARELDTAAVVVSRLFVDRKESTIHEAGDYLFPLKERAITEAHIVGEVGDVLRGTLTGRTSAADITLFKSLGLAVEDIAATHYVYEQARALGRGVAVEIGGQRTHD
ncbi:MAG: ornithine cyclodeaminase family protein [Gemmatimonadaceae bacterium]|nr:ornithine cyclodeaminase family protein [Gemmatimonadaceae bacterium]